MRLRDKRRGVPLICASVGQIGLPPAASAIYNLGRIGVRKVILAMASASGLMLPALPVQALEPDVNLSGTFALSLSYFNNDSSLGRVSDTELENNASNFRLTAAAQEVGLRAFVAYERGADNDDDDTTLDSSESVREFFGGLSGTYGTLLYGRKGTDYKLAGERLDPFYNTSVAGFNGQSAGNITGDNLPSAEGASYGLSNLTNGFTSNTLSYRSPALFGFGGNAAVYVNDDDTSTSDDADYALGLGYANSAWLGLDVGVQALSINGNVVTNSPPGDGEAYRLHGSIGEKLWAVGVSFEIVDVEAERDARQYAFASGSYQLLQDLRLAAAFGNVSGTGTAPGALPAANFDGNGITLGAFYDLTKNLSSYAALRYVKLDDNNEDETTTVATGLKFVFDVDL
jgi:predicted porin